MSLMNQQFVSGIAGHAAYSNGEILKANGAERILMLSLVLSSVKFIGISIGLGVSDLTAWKSGLIFDIVVNGKIIMSINDEICTLLRKEFLPFDFPKNSKVELFATSQHATDIIVASFVRLESL